MYCFNSIVRYSEIDADNYMTLPSILDLMQDCCTFHSEEIGVGIEYLRQAKRAWVLSFWQVVINRYPRMGEKVFAYTWPCDFKGFIGRRSFKIEDVNQNVIAYANSVWSYIDTESGRPARVPKEVEERYVIEAPYDMECVGRKIRLPEEMQQKEPIRAGRFHIDTNYHVNNSKYIMMAEEFLPPYFKVKELRAEYKKPAVLYDVICPRVKAEEGKVTVSLENEAGMPYAAVEFLEERK